MSHLARIQNIPSYLPYPFWVWTFFFFRFSDLLVGAPRAFNRDEGRVFVYVNNKNVSRASLLFFFKGIFMLLSVVQSVLLRPFVCVSLFLSVSVCLFDCVSVCRCLFVHVSVCLSIPPPVFLSAYPSICLSVYTTACPCVCLPINSLLYHVLKLSSFNEAKNYMAENKRPAVFCILGCTRSSRPTWFNGWWHPLRSVWQGDSKSWGPEQGWLSRYVWKSY